MAVLIDDQRVQIKGSDLASVLSAAREHAAKDGRVVVEVHYDGEPLAANDLTEKRDAPVEGSEVRLYTTELHPLVVSTLKQARELLADSRAVHVEAAELLQQDHQVDAMNKVSTVLSSWHQGLQAIQQSAELAAIDLNRKTFEGRPIAGLIGDLARQLGELRDLVNDKDSVGLADVLAYEWPQTCDHWAQLIDELIGWIESAEGGEAEGHAGE